MQHPLERTSLRGPQGDHEVAVLFLGQLLHGEAEVGLDAHVGLANRILHRARFRAARLADRQLFDHARPLANDRLLGVLAHLERLLAECVVGSGPVNRAALHIDVLFLEVDRLAYRLLDDAAIDAHAAALLGPAVVGGAARHGVI